MGKYCADECDDETVEQKLIFPKPDSPETCPLRAIIEQVLLYNPGKFSCHPQIQELCKNFLRKLAKFYLSADH